MATDKNLSAICWLYKVTTPFRYVNFVYIAERGTFQRKLLTKVIISVSVPLLIILVSLNGLEELSAWELLLVLHLMCIHVSTLIDLKVTKDQTVLFLNFFISHTKKSLKLTRARVARSYILISILTTNALYSLMLVEYILYVLMDSSSSVVVVECLVIAVLGVPVIVSFITNTMATGSFLFYIKTLYSELNALLKNELIKLGPEQTELELYIWKKSIHTISLKIRELTLAIQRILKILYNLNNLLGNSLNGFAIPVHLFLHFWYTAGHDDLIVVKNYNRAYVLLYFECMKINMFYISFLYMKIKQEIQKTRSILNITIMSRSAELQEVLNGLVQRLNITEPKLVQCSQMTFDACMMAMTGSIVSFIVFAYAGSSKGTQWDGFE